MIMKRKSSENGYVMIVVMIAMLMVVIATLILVDLQTTVRGKVKIQAAADAAALTGAEWQMKSLNLVGEINMIKASTAIYAYGTTLAQANAALTEMQFRVAVAGPCIGYGAAQQAAKNNGVTTNSDEQTRLEEEITAISGRTDGVDDTTLPWTGWRDPYVNMLSLINGNGATASMLPDLVVEPSWLSSESTLLAVLNFNFCQGGLNSLVTSYGDSYWTSGWQQGVKVYPRSRPGQSSVLSLEVNTTQQQLYPDAAADTLLRKQVAAYGLSMNTDENLESVYFCTLNSRWSNEPSSKWNNSYSGGGMTSGILRRDMSDAARCGGAIAPAICQQDFDLFMNFQPTVTDDTSSDPLNAGGSSSTSITGVKLLKNKSSKGERMLTHYDSGGNAIRRSAHATAYAAAKPFADLTLTEGTRPQELGMVLPIFSQTALVPFRMYTAGIKNRSPRYESFLIWLAQNGSKIGDVLNISAYVTVPSQYAQYVKAIEILCGSDKSYQYPVKDSNGDVVKDATGSVIYKNVDFREYGRLWLEDNTCPSPSGSGSTDIL